MNKKVVIPIIIIVAVFLLGVGIVFSGVADDIIFDQIPYNYTGYTTLPGNSDESGSISGFYHIWGKGRDFNFTIKLPGAEHYDTDSIDGELICYDKNGLSGQGHLDKIDITLNTLTSLIQGDLKKAMFGTVFTGKYNMTCAAWAGGGNFSNNGTNFTGTFVVNGVLTYFGGDFEMVQEDGRIAVITDYIYYPQGQPSKAKNVKKTYYI